MKILNIKKARPISSGGIITTCNRFSEEDCTHGGLLDTTKLNKIKEFQNVVSLSEYASNKGLVVNDLVALTFDRYKKTKGTRKNSLIEDTGEEYGKEIIYELPVILLDSREHLLIDVSDIELIIDEYEYILEGEKNNELILN